MQTADDFRSEHAKAHARVTGGEGKIGDISHVLEAALLSNRLVTRSWDNLIKASTFTRRNARRTNEFERGCMLKVRKE